VKTRSSAIFFSDLGIKAVFCALFGTFLATAIGTAMMADVPISIEATTTH
jgi:hypothetical protein